MIRFENIVPYILYQKSHGIISTIKYSSNNVKYYTTNLNTVQTWLRMTLHSNKNHTNVTLLKIDTFCQNRQLSTLHCFAVRLSRVA